MAINAKGTVSVPLEEFLNDQKIIMQDIIKVMYKGSGQRIDTGTLTIDFKLVDDTVEVVSHLRGRKLSNG